MRVPRVQSREWGPRWKMFRQPDGSLDRMDSKIRGVGGRVVEDGKAPTKMATPPLTQRLAKVAQIKTIPVCMNMLEPQKMM